MIIDFLGNDSAKSLLLRACNGTQRHHAYLIHGADGLGKRTCGQWFAQGLLCTAREKPCGVCSACRKVARHTHPDFIELESKQGKNSIHIDAIREIRKDCAVKPSEGNAKVYLIPSVENMTMGAFNAFLKTLEEPPVHTVFLLTTSEVNGLPATVRSRLLPVSLYPLPEAILSDELRKRFPDRSEQERQQVLSLAGGNLGQAIVRLDEEQEDAKQFCEAIAHKSEYEMLLALSPYERNREGLLALLKQCNCYLRCAIRKEERVLSANCFIHQLTEKQMIAIAEEIELTIGKLNTNANVNLLSAVLCAKIKQQLE